MGIYNFVRSKGYKRAMGYLYGWGAAIVIVGALFKITHWTGANTLLSVGMFTEAAIFFFSAFEPLHVNYKWELVYPELSLGDDPDIYKKNKSALKGTPTQQLDKMLEEAKIGPELIESLATGMKNLSENAQKLSVASDASIITNNYTSHLAKAAESVRNLSIQYDKTAEALNSDQNISAEFLQNLQKATSAVGNMTNLYEQTSKAIETDGNSYTDQLKKLNQNLSSINTFYDIQAQNTQKLTDDFKSLEENIKLSVENTEKYRVEVDKLTKSIAQLSNVYGNMVAAMSLKS